MFLHHLPQFNSQLRTQFARHTCIFIPTYSRRRFYRAFNNNSPVNAIELDSVKDSTITGVSVYPGRAEITRLFKFNIATGQNQLNILGLPAVLDRDSLTIKKRGAAGAATIHGVTISEIDDPSSTPTSLTLKKLLSKKGWIENTKYLESLKLRHLPPDLYRRVVTSYDSAKEYNEDESAKLEDELAETDEAISDERMRLSDPVGNPKLVSKLIPKVSIDVFADFEGAINIALMYVVHNVTWNVGYDIRVNTKKNYKPVTLTYKAGITQNTGEDWNGVPLTLETATPTFGLDVPALKPWNISTGHQLPTKSKPLTLNAPSVGPDQPVMQEPEHHMDVSSTSNVNATFQVPGWINIPSDGIIHNVTIARLDLDATMSYVCVPKKSTKTYLNTKIKNISPYTFLSGQSSVIVDGSVLSKSDVPLVKPKESFDCSLNVEPSIGVIYHPRSVEVFQSGMYYKTTNYLFTQRITIYNTKTQPVKNLKIIDQVPVSEDSKITVKLVRPALRLPWEGFSWGSISTANGGKPKELPPLALNVASGVVAQWHGADEAGVELEALGKDGKLNWVCDVQAQEIIGLVLQWEVVTPVKTTILGLAS